MSRLTRGLLLMLACACGAAVANLYYNQPLLAQMAHSFHTQANRVGLISMCTQIGYALGMFVFVPLGDMRERRSMIVGLSWTVSIFLMAMALGQSILWLDVVSVAIGLTTVVPQLIVPLVADWAPARERGQAIGTVMSGLLVGILLARTLSGFVGRTLGWRGMYWIAAIMMLLLGALLARKLPKSYPAEPLPYARLLRSIGHLVRTHATLREAAFLGAMSFGAFSVFWTSLAFLLEGPPFHMGSQVAGLFGLVGVVGAMAAPIAGRLADRQPARWMVGVALAITMSSFVVFSLWGHRLWGLVLGVILLDMGVQGAQILNQTRIYSLAPEARGRVNMVYMVSSFLGGAIGSSVGTWAWTLGNWTWVCRIGMALACLGILGWVYGRIRKTAV